MKTALPNPKRLEIVYGISSAVASAKNAEKAFDKIVHLARQVIIFDTIVLYELQEDGQLTQVRSRAIGRGRYLEADMDWGELTAEACIDKKAVVKQYEDLSDLTMDRTAIRHRLGVPLIARERIIGALVFIRFGGPPFLDDQIKLAEFIAENVAQLIEHRDLMEQVAKLEARRQLENFQKDFSAMVSHELLSPLGHIKGYTTTLLRKDIQIRDVELNEFLEIINEETDRLYKLINELLDYSRMQSMGLELDLHAVKIDALIMETAERARLRNEKIEIHFTQSEDDSYIYADSARIAQVFENIINNAIKYAPNSPIMISRKSINNKVHIKIEDLGPGIEQEYLPKIFDQFYRVPNQSHRSIPGAGLGLHICKLIIEAHQGEINAESQLGLGTTINIILPSL